MPRVGLFDWMGPNFSVKIKNLVHQLPAGKTNLRKQASFKEEMVPVWSRNFPIWRERWHNLSQSSLTRQSKNEAK